MFILISSVIGIGGDGLWSIAEVVETTMSQTSSILACLCNVCDVLLTSWLYSVTSG